MAKKRPPVSDKTKHREALLDRLEQSPRVKAEDLNTVVTKLKEEIAEHERVAEALTLSRERVKRLSKQSLHMLEADRKTISKELHDSIGASLAAIKFSLEEKELTRKENQGHLGESLDQEIAYLLKTIKETKRISANLRPTTLDDLGLMATIEWYLRQTKQMYGDIQIDYTSEISEQDIPEDMRIIIYRIIQEGLSNAEKHSEASSIRLDLKFADNNKAISLIVEDNGLGFDVEEVLSSKDPLSGYGLTAMQERCEIFGGKLHVASKIGTGTKLIAKLPIQ
jgi:signal transduction histidine kinase